MNLVGNRTKNLIDVVNGGVDGVDDGVDGVDDGVGGVDALVCLSK